MTPRERNMRVAYITSIMAERRMRQVVTRKPNGDLSEHAVRKSTVVPFGTASRRKARRKMARASRRRNRVA